MGERADLRVVGSERSPRVCAGREFPQQPEGRGLRDGGIFTVLAMDGYRANPDRVTALFVAASAAVALIFAPSSFLVVALGSYVVLLLARFPVARRRGTLPHRAVHEVAAEAESAATADAPASTQR